MIGLVAVGAALLLASWLLPGLTISPWWAAVVLAVAVAVADARLRPILRMFAGRVGAVAALVLGVVVLDKPGSKACRLAVAKNGSGLIRTVEKPSVLTGMSHLTTVR